MDVAVATAETRAYQQGRDAFAGDLARRFDFDKQPRNPYPKADPAHQAWQRGLMAACSEWFSEG